MTDPLDSDDLLPDDDPGRPLSREDLQSGGRRDEYIRKRLGGMARSDARLQQWLDQVLRFAPDGDVWIFAYGSLIWNPLFPVAEERVARVALRLEAQPVTKDWNACCTPAVAPPPEVRFIRTPDRPRRASRATRRPRAAG